MYRESDILLEILNRLQDLNPADFLIEAEEIIGQDFGTADDVIWDVTGDCESKTKIGLLN